MLGNSSLEKAKSSRKANNDSQRESDGRLSNEVKGSASDIEAKADAQVHWYCFTFHGHTRYTGKDCQASTYTGYPDQNITLPRINANKKDAGVSDDSVLIACIYLGYMTNKEFNEL